ncbi:hypothetical protein AVEN_215-1 [Araneus ventricosus]|uniref:Uncharacterized protein n=1 Tax=Araneus ventricosus TaxID=182803 RepID=A0A4Y2WR63_ARAVE|nr:hypothetical protein AVEN_215-1 [Araneus ventricosus]
MSGLPETFSHTTSNMEWVNTQRVVQYRCTTRRSFHNQDQDNPEKNEEDVFAHHVSDADAASAVELALRYIEQHTAATSNDVMFMPLWSNIGSSSRFSCFRRKRR